MKHHRPVLKMHHILTDNILTWWIIILLLITFNFFLKLINFTVHFRLLISTLHNWYHHILQNAGKLLLIFSETFSFKWWNITDLFWKCTIFWQTTFSPDELLSYYLLFQFLPRINQFCFTFLGSYPYSPGRLPS